VSAAATGANAMAPAMAAAAARGATNLIDIMMAPLVVVVLMGGVMSILASRRLIVVSGATHFRCPLAGTRSGRRCGGFWLVLKP